MQHTLTRNDSVTAAEASIHATLNGSLADLSRVVHPDAVNRESLTEPPATRGRGPEAFHATGEWLRTAFSELSWTTENTVAESRAVARHVRVTPQKARRVVDLIRGKNATDAVSVLRFAPQGAAEPVRKVLESAIANARVKADQVAERFDEREREELSEHRTLRAWQRVRTADERAVRGERREVRVRRVAKPQLGATVDEPRGRAIATEADAVHHRALEVPAVVGVGRITALADRGDWLIVDGQRGLVVAGAATHEVSVRGRGEMLVVHVAQDLEALAEAERPISAGAAIVHGIRQQDLADAPALRDVAAAIVLDRGIAIDERKS